MKYLLALLFVSTTVLASHSADLGYFYSEHREPGYKYNLHGVAVGYEIGNSIGLKASGKVWMSNDSDLRFIKSRSEIKYLIPAGPVDLKPFVGSQSLVHTVLRNEVYSHVISETFLGGGLIAEGKLKGFVGSLQAGHYQNIANCVTEIEDHTFYGRRLHLDHLYMVTGILGYCLDDNLKVNARGDWEQSYKRKVHTWSTEINASIDF